MTSYPYSYDNDNDLELEHKSKEPYTFAVLQHDLDEMRKTHTRNQIRDAQAQHVASKHSRSDYSTTTTTISIILTLFSTIYLALVHSPVPLILFTSATLARYRQNDLSRSVSDAAHAQALEKKDVLIAELEGQVARMQAGQNKMLARQQPNSIVQLLERNDQFYRRTRRVKARREAATTGRARYPDAGGKMFEEGDRLIRESVLAASAGEPFLAPATTTTTHGADARSAREVGEEAPSRKLLRLRDLLKDVRGRQEATDEALEEAKVEIERLRGNLEVAKAIGREAQSEQLRLVRAFGSMLGERLLAGHDLAVEEGGDEKNGDEENKGEDEDEDENEDQDSDRNRDEDECEDMF